MAMARFSVMYFGHFILFSVFFLLYALLLAGLITRLIKRMTESRASQYSEALGQIDLGLQPGGRAVFYLTATRGIERLITSVITRVSHDHAQSNERRAA